MQLSDLAHPAGVAVVFLLAGLVKGVTGMGLPTVGVSLLGLWMAPAQAAALLVAPALATNVAQCRGPRTGWLLRRLWPLWLGLALSTVLMPAPPVGVDGRLLLGVILIVYGAWGLWKPALPDLSARVVALGGPAGLLTGVVTAWTAVFVIPMVPFLQSLKLDKDTMIQALGLSFTVATLALALRLQRGGQLDVWRWEVLLALVAAFAGMAIGTWIRDRLSPLAFQRGLFLAFIGLGLAGVFHR